MADVDYYVGVNQQMISTPKFTTVPSCGIPNTVELIKISAEIPVDLLEYYEQVLYVPSNNANIATIQAGFYVLSWVVTAGNLTQ